jgi:hypothetical protein
MPKGPRGEKRPADVIGAVVLVAKIATGETEDTKKNPQAAKVTRKYSCSQHSQNGEVSATPYLWSRPRADLHGRCGNLRCTEPRATSRTYGYLIKVAAAALR